MAKWGRGSKVPGYGRLLSKFDQSFSYSGGLIESCPKPGTFDHLPPFAIHILNPLDMRNHRDPLFMGQKCTQYGRETNTSQVFGNCGSLSPPPIVSCRTDVMPWYLDKTLDSSSHIVYNIIFFHLDTLINHKIDLLTRVRVCSVSFSPVDLDGSGTRRKATKPSARSLSRLLLQEQPPQWSQPGARSQS